MEGIKMKCPKCQFDNPDDKKFCRECGVKLLLACPQCAAEILPSDKFCGECGHKLSIPLEARPKELSFDEKLDKIQQYLPKGLAEKILSQKDRIEGERRQVTVMFCDMEGFTQLAERIGPEKAYNTMDQIYEILIHKVHDYEGTVNEFTGDGIMALFGAPIALEDAPQRAIRSAYAIHREMTRFSDKMKQEIENIPPLKMRIGIHTGPVVVGTLGNDLRVEFKAVGDTVNLASRMEGLAEVGSTYVTEDTFRHTQGLFRFEVLGEHAVKGRADTVKAYRVIAPSTRRTRFDVSAERGLTPFVGRERELALLLDGFERSKTGRGQAFSIMSEAGVGKSRLLYEFRKAVANEDMIFLEGKCLSYSRGVTYHPVIDIVKSNFDIAESDGDLEIKEKLQRGLKVLDADEFSTLPYLLELLSVKESGVDPISMSPEARKDQIIVALNRIVIKASQIRPVIMAIEDLHWIDKSSEDTSKALLDSISTEEIDRQLEELILEKTEGIPFFIEEFIKSLKDLKIIERRKTAYHLTKDLQEVTIPSTIQDVIMARVDTLPEGAKELLRIGSVIEREFSYELIKQVSELSEKELLFLMSVLRDSELIYERGVFPESNYIFKHALTREVVYGSVLTKRKKQLHNKIGKAIEEIYEKNIEEHYGILVEHYIAGYDHEKAAEYSKLAGKRAEETGSLSDGIEYLKKRIACLEKLPHTDDVQKKIIDTRTVLGLYYLQINYMIDAKDTVDPIIDLVIDLGYQKRISQIYTIIGINCGITEEDFPKAFKYLNEALKLSEESNDILSSFMANYWLGLGFCFDCQFEKGFQNIEKALEINVATKTLWGISSLKSVISYFVYFLSGKIDLAYKTSDEAIRIGEESGDIYSRGVAYVSHGVSCYGKGLLKEALENLSKGQVFCERIKYYAMDSVAHLHLGEIHYETRNYQKSKGHYEKAAWLIEKTKYGPSYMGLRRIALARAKVMNNEKGIDLESLYNDAKVVRLKIYEGIIQRYIAEILLNIDDQHVNEAEEWTEKAIEADKRNGMMWYLARDYALSAELFNRKGDLPKAKENLSKAVEIFKECCADGWVEKYEKELATL
jgi:class 3 adenylate cyclase/tetratricopeptide (TPR) repeat protein